MRVLFVVLILLVWGLGDQVADEYFAVRQAKRLQKRSNHEQ